MLTSAINFLSDKRKRFQRSDTVPVFETDRAFGKSKQFVSLFREVHSKCDNSALEKTGLPCPSAKMSLVSGSLENLATSTTTDCISVKQHVAFIDDMDEDGHSGSYLGGLPMNRFVHFPEHLSSPEPMKMEPVNETEIFRMPNTITYRGKSGENDSALFHPSLENCFRPLEEQKSNNFSLTPLSIVPNSTSSVKVQNNMLVPQHRDKTYRSAKLQRSKSSAQIPITEQSMQSQSERPHRVRSISNQRERCTADSFDMNRERFTDQRRRRRKGGKYWANRTRRSRSVNTVRQHKVSNCPDESEQTASSFQLTMKGTWDNYYKIRTNECSNILQRGTESLPGFNGHFKDDYSNQPLNSHCHKSNKLPKKALHTADSHSHSNSDKYAPVRRLRRNNSTLNWSSRQTHQALDASHYVPTSQTAGDLFLPSTNVNKNRPNNRDLPANFSTVLLKLFSHIENNDLDQIMANFEQYKQLSAELEANNYNSCNSMGLHPLDVALLTSSPQIILCLMALGFQPGPVFTIAWLHSPESPSTKDPLKLYLTRRIREAEFDIITKRAELEVLVMKANELSQEEVECNQESNLVKSVYDIGVKRSFDEVTDKEGDIKQSIASHDRLITWQKGIHRFPRKPMPPGKVKVLVVGPSSIVVRISSVGTATKQMQPYCDPNNIKQMQEDIDASTSGESESEEDAISLREGRRAPTFTKADCSKILLAYRIEWSTSPVFTENESHSQNVQLPVRLSPFQHLHSSITAPHDKSIPSYRTAFYELAGLEPERTVFVRVYSVAARGWSKPTYAEPFGIAPSSWYAATKTEVAKVTESQSSQTHSIAFVHPVRYAGKLLDRELYSLKQLLDHQLLQWICEQSTSATDASNPNHGATDEGGKRTKSPMLQRKRSFRFPFASKGIKFVRQTKSGLYLALLCHTVKSFTDDNEEQIKSRQIVTVDDSLPMLCITREEYGSISALSGDFHWFARLVADPSVGPDLQIISENLLRNPAPTNLQLRFKLLSTLQQLQLALGSSDVGSLYPELFQAKRVLPEVESLSVTPEYQSVLMKLEECATPESCTALASVESGNHSSSSAILVLVKRVNVAVESSFTSGLRWSSVQKFLRQNKVNPEMLSQLISNADTRLTPMATDAEREARVSVVNASKIEASTASPEINLVAHLSNLLASSDKEFNTLVPGLYIVFIQMKAHMDQQAKILVSKSLNHPYMPPTERVRRRTHVTRKEWEAIWLAVSPPVKIASVEKSSLKFCAKLYRAMHKLATRLGYSEEDHEQLRLYLTEVVQISPHHSLILIFPSIDRVCLPPTANDPTPPGCAWCSMAFFERHLGITYDPKFHRRAYTLLAMLELLVPISNFMQRQCISDSEWTKCSERTNALQSLLQTVDALLSEKRWLSDAIGTARDRKRIYPATLNMGEMKRYLELSVASKLKEESSVELTNIVREKLVEETKKYSTISSVDSLVNSLSAKIRRHTDETFSNVTENVRLKGIDIVTRSAPISRGDEKPANVLRIYVEYPTGLPHGICVRVSAKLTTTSRDIVEMTVHRVAQTVKQKSLLQNPRWLNEHECGSLVTPDLCCLVVNLGTVERKLLSTVRPLLLQHPWRSGRFCVRLMKNVHSSITRTNSPVNVYLAAAQNAQKLNTQPMFYPVRTYKARITEVLTSCKMATISPSLTVYVNGLPIQNHDNRNC